MSKKFLGNKTCMTEDHRGMRENMWYNKQSQNFDESYSSHTKDASLICENVQFLVPVGIFYTGPVLTGVNCGKDKCCDDRSFVESTRLDLNS